MFHFQIFDFAFTFRLRLRRLKFVFVPLAPVETRSKKNNMTLDHDWKEIKKLGKKDKGKGKGKGKGKTVG